ncbi:tyrosine-type recombinase/integrase [Mycobacterium talmoniae]|uniref:Tyrosine recombinase XerC n=1 Tax=Mycobacterium talmoniae TaxID=1858794 RepID=A0A1S1MYJ9_9MYCO|nr:tyrosine-type recombinase/integrase [Mycobacterium talmoniae]OHU92458.1 hypothetical protein BKN37_24845 [Mycobacterium talmoniae]
MPSGRQSTTVVDEAGCPIEDADRFLLYLHAIDSSPNTIESYARHLALFFRWLDVRGADWCHLDFDGLCMFAHDLADGTLRSLERVGEYRPQAPRSRSTCEAVLAAVHSFLNYWRLEGRGPQELQLYGDSGTGRRKSYSFLAHVKTQPPATDRRLKVRGPNAKAPKIINFESDFQLLIHAANTARDRLLLSGLFDGGLRVSQCLGILHEDLDIARRRSRIVRRTNNANGALSKQRNEFTVDLPTRFFDYYAQSLMDEQLALGIDSDYVFVNLQLQNRGRPMSYANAIQVVTGIGDRAGVKLTPHTLRHTHGTALAREGWSAPQIAKRLGQASATSADKYIHLADDDISDKYWQSNLARTER